MARCYHARPRPISPEGLIRLPNAALPYEDDLHTAIAAALAGGAVVKDFYDRAAAETYVKKDGSPVTDADLASDREIRRVLAERSPHDAILTEEGVDDEARLSSRRVWIADPIDGTEQFINRTGEFDVLIALVEDGVPVAVAGYQPSEGVLMTATLGGGAWLQQGDGPRQRLVLEPVGAAPRLATTKWFGAPENAPIMRALAARLGLPAGDALVTGLTPRMFNSPRAFDVMIGARPGEDQRMASEWDFAVSDLLLREAGGVITDLSGQRFRYNKRLPHNMGGLIAAVDPATHARVLAAVTAERESGGLTVATTNAMAG
jgi:3'-phosphoadenosine 5'-phosphosulfate (PAPS) 3'-phosphatase